jgi:hypothetical protein
VNRLSVADGESLTQVHFDFADERGALPLRCDLLTSREARRCACAQPTSEASFRWLSRRLRSSMEDQSMTRITNAKILANSTAAVEKQRSAAAAPLPPHVVDMAERAAEDIAARLDENARAGRNPYPGAYQEVVAPNHVVSWQRIPSSAPVAVYSRRNGKSDESFDSSYRHFRQEPEVALHLHARALAEKLRDRQLELVDVQVRADAPDYEGAESVKWNVIVRPAGPSTTS